MITIHLIDSLRKKGILVTEIHNWGPYLRGKWESHFAHGIDSITKKDIYMDQFLWHLFSYDVVPCMMKEEAITTFNDIKKDSCFIFYQLSNEAYILENARKLQAEDIAHEDDIYVVNKESTWTFVKTHEEYCGPYFLKKSE